MKMELTEWAAINGLTPREFKAELFTAACAAATMEIDYNGNQAVIFTCSDSVGDITLTVERG